MMYRGRDQTTVDVASDTLHVSTQEVAVALLKLRLLVSDRLFDGEFVDGGWNILLDLFVRERRGCATSVSSACVASLVPTTTALRCLRDLECRGLVRRVQDCSDRRRVFVELSEETTSCIRNVLKEVGSSLLQRCG